MTASAGDIFISYSNSDRDRIAPLVDALQADGWSVWWDRRILPGQSWNQVIESALTAARCVIVVWSTSSVASTWVRAEAEDARTRGILVPILVDNVKIPFPFGQIQAADLTGWAGRRNDHRLDDLRQAVRAVLTAASGSPAPEAAAPPSPAPAPPVSVHEEQRAEPAGLPEWLATPRAPDPQKPFLMPIEDIFAITGRGTVVTGRVENGICRVGDHLEIVGIAETRNVSITGIEMFKRLIDEARPGDNVGVLLRGISKDEVQRGQVLAKPGSIRGYRKFQAELYILPEAEGGRPVLPGAPAQVWFRVAEVAGTVKLAPGTQRAMPGHTVRLEIELASAWAMEKETRFAIREAGKIIAAGRVLAPLA